MSKSLGNTIAPQDVIKESGAEILRLWVAMSDYTRGDARQQGDPRARRRGVPQAAQHAAGILVANLYDFDPATDRVPRRRSSRRSIATRWRATRTRRSGCSRAYDEYDFPTIFQALNAFATVDLSAFYVDVSKDRLYTFARALARAALGADGDVPDRRRARAAAGADPAVHGRRAVAVLPGARARHRCTSALFPDAGDARRLADPALLDDWERLLRAARAGERGARAAAQGQGDRQLAQGAASRSSARGADSTPARAVRGRPADAVHRVGGRAASQPADATDRVARRRRARRRREVRALLAVRAGGLDASRTAPGSATAAWTRWPSPSRRDHGARDPRRSCAGVRVGCRSRSIVVADQVDEGDRRASSSALHESVTVIPGFLDLTHVRNTGAAFGFLNAVDFPVQDGRDRGRRARPRSSASALYAAQLPPTQLARAARAGADHRRRGRQPDRPRAAGYVVDFVDVYWRDWHFWAFNVADSAITVGVAHDDSRHARRAGRRRVSRDCFIHSSSSARSPSTPTACCWPPRTCSACSWRWSRAKARGLDANRVLDLGIYIIISALVGAKLLLLDRRLRSVPRDPARAADAGAIGRRVLRRADPRGRRRVLVHPPARAAALDDVRRVRAGHRARPRRRPARLPARRLLLRQADDVPWAITFTNPFAAANVGTPLGVPLHPTQLYESGRRAADPGRAARAPRRRGRAVPGPDVLALHAALRDLALHHRVLPRRRRAASCSACSRRRSSSRSCSRR